MNFVKLALPLLACLSAGCTSFPSTPQVSMANLPNCFDNNYDAQRRLFTMKDAPANAANQQCLLTVRPSGSASSALRLVAGSYMVHVANSGDSGAGGTIQGRSGGGGGGGGGAGSVETLIPVVLTEGSYKLTIGAGGPGGSACTAAARSLGGGPGWLGSPSNIVRVATGELVAGTAGAESFVRPTRSQNDRLGQGGMDGQGGSGPGQTSGGDGGQDRTATAPRSLAEAGDAAAGHAGGDAGLNLANPRETGGGGGGGSTSRADGGSGGGGETVRYSDLPPERGTLGSGGGGGEGNSTECDAGAPGGNGFIALRRR